MNQLQDRIKTIENQIKETTSEYTKAILEERLACLTGGIGVIRVGAYTDTDFNAKKYKFENAINSTQAALQEGILPGGGIALANIEIADDIFRKALIAPLKQMAINSGSETQGLDELHVIREADSDWGIDFKENITKNLWEAGIIDPYKVVRLALESAVSIAMTLITTEVAIIDEKEEINAK